MIFYFYGDRTSSYVKDPQISGGIPGGKAPQMLFRCPLDE